MFGEMNKGKRTLPENVKLDKMKFAPLSGFEGQELEVEGFFFTSGDYGKQVVVVANGYKVNMPKRAVELFEEIAADPEKLEAVLDGKLKIVNIVSNVKTKSGKTTTYELADA